MSGSTHLTNNFTGTGTSTGDKVTYSVWIKRMNPEGDTRSTIISAAQDGTNYTKIRFADDDKFHIYGLHSNSTNFNVYADKECRDTNAWLHLVWQIDTTHATESERVKVWINGESISISGQMPSQNHPVYTLKENDMEIGRNAQSDDEHFDGLMSHFHCCHGYLYNPTSFGETDATTGEWKIIASPSVSYGTKGWFIFKDNASVSDQSGNGNDFTVSGGSLEASEDNPSNSFCVMSNHHHDYANDNTDLGSSNNFVYPRANTNFNYAVSNMAMPKGNGKFYAEVKYIAYDSVNAGVGIIDVDYATELFYENRSLMEQTQTTYLGRVIYTKNGYSIVPSTENQSYGSSWSDGDIIQIACDMENGAIYFGKNGTWQNSGDPTSGASKTGAIDISAQSWYTSTSHWQFWCGDKTSNHDRFSWNFGNGYFPTQSGSFGSQTYGGTTVSSAGTNASNNGIFEYDVPTGYTALCTKGLNL